MWSVVGIEVLEAVEDWVGRTRQVVGLIDKVQCPIQALKRPALAEREVG